MMLGGKMTGRNSSVLLAAKYLWKKESYFVANLHFHLVCLIMPEEFSQKYRTNTLEQFKTQIFKTRVNFTIKLSWHKKAHKSQLTVMYSAVKHLRNGHGETVDHKTHLQVLHELDYFSVSIPPN